MLILASGSPRRRELLTQIGVAYMVNPSTYSEESPKKRIRKIRPGPGVGQGTRCS